MAADPEPPEALDGLMERLRATVADRRARGDYPADLEERLDRHFERIRRLRADDDHLEPVRQAVAELDRRSQFSLAHNVASRNALGERYHRALLGEVTRQVEPLVDQIRGYSRQLREVFEVLIARLDDPGSHVHADLLGQIDAAVDRLGQLGSMPAGAGRAHHTSAGEAPDVARSARRGPSFDGEDYETYLRGAPDDVALRYRGLVDHLGADGPVLDLACGRGELLTLISQRGVKVQGWESDRLLALVGRDRGLPIEVGDAFAGLGAAADVSLAAVVSVRALERMDRQGLADLVVLAADKLAARGTLVLSAADPESPHPLARRIRSDLTAAGAVYPEALGYICHQAGLENVATLSCTPAGWVDAAGTAPGEAPLFAVVARR